MPPRFRVLHHDSLGVFLWESVKMDVPIKLHMDLIERAARAAFPDFECLDVRGGEVFLCKKDGESGRFNPLAYLAEAFFLAESLAMEFSGQGALWASARAMVNETTISEICASNDGLVKNHSYQPVCVAITRCAAMAWELKKCKQSQ